MYVYLLVACIIILYGMYYNAQLNEGFKNNKLSNVKKKHNRRINNIRKKEKMVNVDVFDTNSIKDFVGNYYKSFDNKLMNSPKYDMDTMGKKWNFMKERFWNIFEI